MVNVRILANWDISNLWRISPRGDGIWQNINFNPDSDENIDYVLVLNHLTRNYTINVPPDHVWALMQEPYIRGRHEYMVEKHHQYSKVFTHAPPNSSSKYTIAPPLTPWFFNKGYQELKNIAIPEKDYNLSCIVSNKVVYEGHKKRLDFVNSLITSDDLKMKTYGRGFNYIKDKWDGLAPYKYSVAIENTSKENYWTEKVADCFLSYTVPIYFGCTNLMEYFPENSYIWIDINDRKKSKKIIEDTIANDDWEDRIKSLESARNLVLDTYQIFPFIGEQIIQSGTAEENAVPVTLKKYNNLRLRNISMNLSEKWDGKFRRRQVK